MRQDTIKVNEIRLGLQEVRSQISMVTEVINHLHIACGDLMDALDDATDGTSKCDKHNESIEELWVGEYGCTSCHYETFHFSQEGL